MARATLGHHGQRFIVRQRPALDGNFFFVDYEGSRVAGQAVLAPNVPSMALRSGGFSQVPGITVRDLFSGTGFAGNRIPAGRLEPYHARTPGVLLAA